jgi:hypothetical protein
MAQIQTHENAITSGLPEIKTINNDESDYLIIICL